MNDLAKVNYFCGDIGLVDEAINEILSSKNIEIHRIEERQYTPENALKLILTSSMFGKKKVFIVYKKTHFDFKKAENKIPENNIIIIKDDIPNDSDLYKWIKENGKIFELGEINSFKMHKWIKEYLSKNNSSMDDDALRLLAEFGPKNTVAMKQELEKLISFSNFKKISLNHIKEVCQAEISFNIWSMIDALTDMDCDAALKYFNMYYNEEHGNHNIDRILSIIQWHFKLMLLILDLKEKGLETSAIVKFISLLKKNSLNKKQYAKFLEKSKEERESAIKKMPSIYKDYSIKKAIFASKNHTQEMVRNIMIELNNIIIKCRTAGLREFYTYMSIFILKSCKKMPMRIS